MSAINKILVIGAGIAGPAVCYWLKRFGFSPILIERSSQIRKGGQGLDVRGVAIDIVKRMGIYEKICNMRTQVELGRYVDAEGNILHEEKGERFAFRQGEDVEINRGDLVEILIQTIEGVPSHFNQWIDSIKQSDNDVEVRFKDGRTEHYDLVIGADGLHSKTRRIVFNDDEYKLTNLGLYFSVFSIPNYLKQAGGNYHRAFNRYNELLHPFVKANQKLGVLVNESTLVRDEVSQEVAEERSNKIMQEVEIAANMISLPNYE